MYDKSQITENPHHFSLTRFLRGVAFFYYYFYYYDLGVLISTHIADASAATTYTARGAVSENKFPKGPIEKAHEFSITSTERIERKERGEVDLPKDLQQYVLDFISTRL